MRLLLSSLAFLFMAGCTHVGHRETVGPDGDQVFEAYCHGNHGSFADCMQEAQATCGGTYKVLDKDQAVTAGTYGGQVYSKTSRHMLFTCND